MTNYEVWAIAKRVCTDREFEALTLHVAGGKTYREIAAICGISHAAVYDRISSAKRKLASELDGSADQVAA